MRKSAIYFAVIISTILIIVSLWIYFWYFGIIAGITLFILTLLYAKYEKQIKTCIKEFLQSWITALDKK